MVFKNQTQKIQKAQFLAQEIRNDPVLSSIPEALILAREEMLRSADINDEVISQLTQLSIKFQQAQAEQHVANFSMTATKCAGAIEVLTAVLNDKKKK